MVNLQKGLFLLYYVTLSEKGYITYVRIREDYERLGSFPRLNNLRSTKFMYISSIKYNNNNNTDTKNNKTRHQSYGPLVTKVSKSTGKNIWSINLFLLVHG